MIGETGIDTHTHTQHTQISDDKETFVEHTVERRFSQKSETDRLESVGNG
jgi:hypothetical protein